MVDLILMVMLILRLQEQPVGMMDQFVGLEAFDDADDGDGVDGPTSGSCIDLL